MWRSLAAARFKRGLAVRECADDAGASPNLAQDAFQWIINWYEILGAAVPLRSSKSWRMVRPSGQRHREHEGAGRSRFLADLSPPHPFARPTEPIAHLARTREEGACEESGQAIDTSSPSTGIRRLRI